MKERHKKIITKTMTATKAMKTATKAMKTATKAMKTATKAMKITTRHHIHQRQ